MESNNEKHITTGKVIVCKDFAVKTQEEVDEILNTSKEDWQKEKHWNLYLNREIVTLDNKKVVVTLLGSEIFESRKKETYT